MSTSSVVGGVPLRVRLALLHVSAPFDLPFSLAVLVADHHFSRFRFLAFVSVQIDVLYVRLTLALALREGRSNKRVPKSGLWGRIICWVQPGAEEHVLQKGPQKLPLGTHYLLGFFPQKWPLGTHYLLGFFQPGAEEHVLQKGPQKWSLGTHYLLGFFPQKWPLGTHYLLGFFQPGAEEHVLQQTVIPLFHKRISCRHQRYILQQKARDI